MTLAQVIETRLKETDTVWVDQPQAPPKDKVAGQKPRYSLAELLFEPTGDRDPDGPDDGDISDDSFAHLAAALLP